MHNVIMIEHPFSLLAPYKNQLKVAMLTKEDAIRTDAEVAALVEAKKIAGLHQVHGKTTVVTQDTIDRDIQADGLITDVPGLTLTIRWADCQNFIIYAPEHQIVGLLHAGWRGVDCGAISEFFRELRAKFHIDPHEVLVGAGPSLCTHCAEFTDPTEELVHVDSKYFEKRCVDLQQAATDQLLEAGVRANTIERLADCTKCHPETYWTYRGGDREEVIAGKVNMLTAMLCK